jgi:nucleotide-binding universal stress UspA family protein
VAAIVCGIDDSPGAREALRVASALSVRFGARLVLAHVADGFATAGDESLTTNLGRRGGERLLEEAARRQRVQVENRVEVGDPAETLARIAAEEAASLIVLGSRRRGRLRPRLRSAVADELAAAAPCPVVVVPPATPR